MMTIKEAERLGIMKALERKKLTYQEANEPEISNQNRIQTRLILSNLNTSYLGTKRHELAY